MKTEAEIGVMCLQAQEHQGCWPSPEAERGAWNRFCPRALRRNQPYRHLDYRLLASATMREQNSLSPVTGQWERGPPALPQDTSEDHPRFRAPVGWAEAFVETVPPPTCPSAQPGSYLPFVGVVPPSFPDEPWAARLHQSLLPGSLTQNCFFLGT